MIGFILHSLDKFPKTVDQSPNFVRSKIFHIDATVVGQKNCVEIKKINVNEMKRETNQNHDNVSFQKFETLKFTLFFLRHCFKFYCTDKNKFLIEFCKTGNLIFFLNLFFLNTKIPVSVISKHFN